MQKKNEFHIVANKIDIMHCPNEKQLKYKNHSLTRWPKVVNIMRKVFFSEVKLLFTHDKHNIFLSIKVHHGSNLSILYIRSNHLKCFLERVRSMRTKTIIFLDWCHRYGRINMYCRYVCTIKHCCLMKAWKSYILPQPLLILQSDWLICHFR